MRLYKVVWIDKVTGERGSGSPQPLNIAMAWVRLQRKEDKSIKYGVEAVLVKGDKKTKDE